MSDEPKKPKATKALVAQRVEDVLRIRLDGRLYLVCAPTYSMLSDATFRSFLTLAQELGIIDPAEVKRSAPPSIRLRTGAEVLFRSADEPERLRGPNLSGVWLDEASLMPLDAYSIAIGRLREAGEQGWLTATFPPKGRLHWTYDTFASGRPDTAIFHARTADNPFLPAGFTETVRQQYTSTLAAQELEGDFIDAGDTLFQRGWFPIVDTVPRLTGTPEFGTLRSALASKVRGWDLAATPKDERKARDPDWTAGVLLGKGRDGTHYVLDVRRTRGRPSEVEELVRQTAEEDGRGARILMEQEPGSAGISIIDHYLCNVLSGFNFHGVRSTGSKADRAQPLAAQAEGSTVKLLRGPWNRDLLDELEMFPFGPHDDMVDALTLAFGGMGSLMPRPGEF